MFKPIIISACLCELFLWPKPSKISYGNYTTVVSNNFKFQGKGNSELKSAIWRYEKLIKNEKWEHIVPTFKSKNQLKNGTLSFISIMVKNKKETLSLETNESYSINIGYKNNQVYGVIEAENIYGVMRGLETISQLITYDKATKQLRMDYLPIMIKDSPKFQHRGLLLDTSRNFFSIDSIKRKINTMSYNKMNVFHWHMLDATSFPFKSERYPKLWKVGVYSKEETYSKEQIRDVVSYGLERGVRVIPEIEAPAHAYVIGKAYPELGVCLDEDKYFEVSAEPPSGQLDPTNPKSINLVKGLIEEFSER